MVARPPIELSPDIVDLVGAEADLPLRRWAARTGTDLRYAGWNDQGSTQARLLAVYATVRTNPPASSC
jgi:hypothetical protein